MNPKTEGPTCSRRPPERNPKTIVGSNIPQAHFEQQGKSGIVYASVMRNKSLSADVRLLVAVMATYPKTVTRNTIRGQCWLPWKFNRNELRKVLGSKKRWSRDRLFAAIKEAKTAGLLRSDDFATYALIEPTDKNDWGWVARRVMKNWNLSGNVRLLHAVAMTYPENTEWRVADLCDVLGWCEKTFKKVMREAREAGMVCGISKPFYYAWTPSGLISDYGWTSSCLISVDDPPSLAGERAEILGPSFDRGKITPPRGAKSRPVK